MKPIGWITHESVSRLRMGGNCRGTVPLHFRPTIASQVPVYDGRDPMIAASPDMLKALKELFDTANHFNANGKWFTDDDYNREILMNAEAAIAAAEGKE